VYAPPGQEKAQYRVAVWPTAGQRAACVAAAVAHGKEDVPVFPSEATGWYDGEASHQRFFG